MSIHLYNIIMQKLMNENEKKCVNILHIPHNLIFIEVKH